MSTTSVTQSATPAKLRNGSWGARVPGRVSEGDTITITTRAGKSWQARVQRVLWSGDGVSIVATQSGGRRGRRSGGRRRGGCSDCGGPIVDAPHHRAMGGLCGSCAFDEFDM